MALRVLLADESSTIKKVFQLALQDFAVEVKSVGLGIDVLPVAHKFQPDIIFADVLLQKQSGYEVSAELKKDPQLKVTPVVLMWSGFMELDQDKFEASGANSHLEKPFDVQALRKLIQRLVPKTQNQDLAKFLKFPKMPEFIDPHLPPPKAPAKPAEIPVTKPEEKISRPTPPQFSPAEPITGSDWSMDDFADVPEVVPDATSGLTNLDDLSEELQEIEAQPGEEFSDEIGKFEQIKLKSPPRAPTAAQQSYDSDEELILDPPDETEAPWAQEDLTRFRIKPPIDEKSAEIPDVEYPDPDESLDDLQLTPQKPKTHATKGTAAKSSLRPADSLLIENSVPIVSAVGGDDGDLELEDVPEVEVAEEQEEASLPRLDPSRVEEILKLQFENFLKEKAKEYLEEVIWKVVPELAERMIERELKRLLEEFEPQQYR